MQVDHLLSIWISGGEESKELHKKLDEKIDSYAAGELEYAAEAIFSIWDLARKDGALPPLPKAHKGVPPLNPVRWDMRNSLIKSMRGGSLLHRKYWARRSRGGNIGPIYLPTIVSGPTLSQVDTCKWD